MRINTKVVSDIESGRILERESFDYDGPLEMCDPSALSKIANIATIGTTGAGFVGNILNSITRGKAVGKLENIENLTPEQLAAKVAGATKPLDRALVENVQNQVQADVATRGLAQAPGIFAAEESQALAPFEQANQQTALQLILKQLGIPSEILANTQGGSDPTLALMMLMLRNQMGSPKPPTPNEVPDTSGITSDTAQIIQDILASQVPLATTPPILPTGGGVD